MSDLDALWNMAAIEKTKRPSSYPPEGAARRYLEHAIAENAPPAHAVRLKMHGEIKLGKWCFFSAEEVIQWNRAMMWRASVSFFGIAIRGGDTWLDGLGMSHWKAFGLIPLVNASGADVTRGRRYFGSSRFEQEGEFFRVTIDDAVYEGT